jgi:hypothetical protein
MHGLSNVVISAEPWNDRPAGVRLTQTHHGLGGLNVKEPKRERPSPASGSCRAFINLQSDRCLKDSPIGMPVNITGFNNEQLNINSWVVIIR